MVRDFSPDSSREGIASIQGVFVNLVVLCYLDYKDGLGPVLKETATLGRNFL